LLAFQAASLIAARGKEDTRVSLAAKLGVVPFDYDLDGHWEIFSGEGQAEPDVNKFEGGHDFKSAPQLLWNSGGGWQKVLAAGGDGSAWTQPLIARGIAVADIDGDGDLDVIVAQNDGSPLLLRNDLRANAPWLRVQLVAKRGDLDAGGAKVEVHTPRRVFVQTVQPAMGFMAQSESTLTFGLGEDARVRKIVVRWPSGQRQEVRPDAIDRVLVIREP
jgi:hypothetical protein